MKLRTSYFNAAVLRKNITRFAPVWGLYGIFLLLTLLLLDSTSASLAQSIADIMGGIVWINLIYAFVCAAMLFGDLFNPRMSNALHALPMRREGWFLTNLVSGLLFCLIPNLLAALIAGGLMLQYAYMALIWLAVSMLQFLFFFGTAAFSAQCAGNRLGMGAVYLIINFLAVLIYWLAALFYEPLLYGVRLELDNFDLFCPVLYMTGAQYVEFNYNPVTITGALEGFCPESWQYLWAAAVIGAVLLAVSVLLYRRRRLESAGDFIALRPAAPVFLVIYALAAAAIFYTFSELFDNGSMSYIFLAVGLAVGFFTGKMLLDRTVKVFRPKVFLGLLGLAAVLVGSMVITSLDPLGITRYIPEAEDIQSLRFYSSVDSYMYESTNRHYPVREITQPEEMEDFRQLHAQLAEDRGEKYGSTCQIRLQYKLKDGTAVTRYYEVAADSQLGQTVKAYLSDFRSVFHTNDYESFCSRVTLVEIDLYLYDKEGYQEDHTVITEPEQIHGLLEAVALDCAAGNTAQDWSFHQDEDSAGWLYLEASYIGYDVNIYDSCTNTRSYLETLIQAQNSTD